MIVMKFGGTSVEDAAAMGRVIEIIRSHLGRKPLVVLSAGAGVTNELIQIARTVRDGNQADSLGRLRVLHDRHREIAHQMVKANDTGRIMNVIDQMFTELEKYVHGVYLLAELTDRSLDAFVSYGERLSSLILQGAMNECGVHSILVDAREVMITDDCYCSAQPQLDKVTAQARRVFAPALEAGTVVVTQGFIGASEDGTTTTIGRGGSDLSAAIFGAVLGAEEIQIWTDVDGMMTADPRVVPDSRLIGAMSFSEASELAYFGAKVLHPKTILPAVENNIPVRILNSRKSEAKGTLILRTVSPELASGQPGEVIKSIAFKKGITVLNVSSSRMLMAHGFLARLFSIFAEHRKSVDVVATSEVSVSLTVDSGEGLQEVVLELEKIGDTRIIPNRAIVCIVGEGMRRTPGIAARIFGALARAKINIEMISEGASEINLTLVVDEPSVEAAVGVLHDEFFSKIRT